MLAIVGRVLAISVFAATGFVCASVTIYMAYYDYGPVPSTDEVHTIVQRGAMIAGVLLAIALSFEKLWKSR
jgi:hypothetical protein